LSQLPCVVWGVCFQFPQRVVEGYQSTVTESWCMYLAFFHDCLRASEGDRFLCVQFLKVFVNELTCARGVQRLESILLVAFLHCCIPLVLFSSSESLVLLPLPTSPSFPFPSSLFLTSPLTHSPTHTPTHPHILTHTFKS